jgi:7,8-dihydro-6-hydroxymethylpterin-pyrophosphokinase
MDILFYNDRLINTKELVIPHPRMHKRRFVLTPICDIAPDMVHPTLKKSMKHLLDRLDEHSQKVFAY